MQQYGPCSGCGEVQVPLGNCCVNCCYPDKQERGAYVDRLHQELDRACLGLKDRFVLAALPVASEMLRLNYSKPLDVKEVVGLAYELADEMLARRARDQQKP